MSNSHDIERWITELKAAGWVEVRMNVWRAPDGALFRGPYGAWCALHGEYAMLAARQASPEAEAKS